jgi:Fic family protein
LQKEKHTVDAALFAQMLHDKHFFDLEKLQYKYSADAVDELLRLVGSTMTVALPLADFNGQPLCYLPNLAPLSGNGMKQMLRTRPGNTSFGLEAMADEIEASLSIESIRTSRHSIRRILAGYAPQNEAESRVFGMKRGLEFIAQKENRITEENLHRLYQCSIGDFLPPEDRLASGQLYRHDAVYVVGGKVQHQGLPAAQLPRAMAQLIAFANADDTVDELHKASILHFYLAYLHPYFDGNGRAARLLHLWYLVQKGYSSALFIPFSRYIEASRRDYYRAYERVEQNARISGRVDVTPYIAYFTAQVYDRLMPVGPPQASAELYQQALTDGKITPKENELWAYVLSAYGNTPFSTKQLERDFGNAAYATIRAFVQKFARLGLLHAQSHGNRVRYWV